MLAHKKDSCCACDKVDTRHRVSLQGLGPKTSSILRLTPDNERFVSTAALSRLVRDRTYFVAEEMCVPTAVHSSGQRRDVVYGFSHRGFSLLCVRGINR